MGYAVAVADGPAGPATVSWSELLEQLHEESSRSHFLDRWTRSAALERLVVPAATETASPTIADVGCSSGYMLEDLRAAFPEAALIGIDLVASGLRKAHDLVPSAKLLHADACALPLEDGSVDALVSLNLLEHIGNDRAALDEFARVLAPGSTAVIVVPAAPRTYDYYDRFLGHERRYRRGELAAKCAGAGLEVLEDLHLAAFPFPAFWLAKKFNRVRFNHLHGEALTARVQRDIARTRDSRLGHVTWGLERRLVGAGVRLPFGIRSLVVARQPWEHARRPGC